MPTHIISYQERNDHENSGHDRYEGTQTKAEAAAAYFYPPARFSVVVQTSQAFLASLPLLQTSDDKRDAALLAKASRMGYQVDPERLSFELFVDRGQVYLVELVIHPETFAMVTNQWRRDTSPEAERTDGWTTSDHPRADDIGANLISSMECHLAMKGAGF
jgi:hypothetical protein